MREQTPTIQPRQVNDSEITVEWPVYAAVVAERDSLRTEQTRLREALEWKPIATAPKTGRHIMLTWSSLVALGYWDGLKWWTHMGTGFPTHWMETPDPPAALSSTPTPEHK